MVGPPFGGGIERAERKPEKVGERKRERRGVCFVRVGCSYS